MSDKFKIIKEDSEVYFQENDSKTIPFKMLSEGYKTTLIWLCDLLSRMIENQPKITKLSEFEAIVLIDEVDLYLHPKWKYDFMFKLRAIFPKIQFIMTTHSLVTILGASKDSVFYKIYKENGDVKISNQMANKGYTHNSLASSPLFDLDTITSREYDKRRVSSDDYVYDKIHKVVSARIKEDINTSEDEIMRLINEEIDKL
jgi:predicted ATP-binding protein involved in virulence